LAQQTAKGAATGTTTTPTTTPVTTAPNPAAGQTTGTQSKSGRRNRPVNPPGMYPRRPATTVAPRAEHPARLAGPSESGAGQARVLPAGPVRAAGPAGGVPAVAQ